MEQAAVVQPDEAVGERRERAGGRLLVVELRQFGHPVGFADHQSPQLHDRFLQDRAQVVGGQRDRSALEVGGVAQCRDRPRNGVTVLSRASFTMVSSSSCLSPKCL